jgi:superfamily I DNA and/or RNA helicase
LIVEEAAEVLEAHLVTSLNHGCQHVILIGDHHQLRPNPAVYKLAIDYHMDVSLFERLIRNRFQWVFAFHHNLLFCSHTQLSEQHRMRTEISQLFMPHFYDVLADHASTTSREHVRGMQKDVLFINHDQQENAS